MKGHWGTQEVREGIPIQGLKEIQREQGKLKGKYASYNFNWVTLKQDFPTLGLLTFWVM